nr:hypothetical protein [uncultured Draconibacterium sp.]
MADVTVTIEINALSYQTWLRTSHVGIALNQEGAPRLMLTELGPDQEDAFNNLLNQAAMEVLKLFVSRQGDAEGEPFEQSSTEIIYRFSENTDTLTQAAALKLVLADDVKNAIYTQLTLKWFSLKANADQVALLVKEYAVLSAHITGNLYRLHD